MGVSLTNCHRLFLAGAVFLLAVAVVIAAGVIPPVRTDPFPGATPQAAVPAFWVNVAFSVVAAVLLGLVARRATVRARRLSFALGLLAVLILLFAFALSDAAVAYGAHGPALQTARTLLFYCVAADMLAVLLIIAATLSLPRQS